MNRQERRRLRKRRAFGIAGVSLAAASGLFGSYLGNPRLPRAYASGTCAAGSGSATFDIGSQADFKSAVTAMNASFVDNSCFTLNITADFTVNEDLASTHVIAPPNGGIDDAVITVNGNGHIVSGDPGYSRATFLKIDLSTFDTNDPTTRDLNGSVSVSDLTVSGMRRNGPLDGFAIFLASDARGTGSVSLDGVVVRDSQATSSSDDGAFAAVRLDANRISVTDSTFSGNSLTRTGSYGSWGGVAITTTAGGAGFVNTITNSTFSNNSVTALGGNITGGALWAYDYVGYGGTTTVDGSTFTGNTITTASGNASGAAISTPFTDLTVTDSIFTGNVTTAPYYARGGAIAVRNWIETRLTVVSSEFTGNEAVVTGGNGYSRAMGGAIYSRTLSKSTVIESSTFSGNSAIADAGSSNGGAVWVRARDTDPNTRSTFINSTFTGNRANTDLAGAGSRSRGGAIWSGQAPLTVDFSTMTDNESLSATADAGAVWAYDATIRNSIVNRNTAARFGADVNGRYAVTALNSLFTSGAAVYGPTPSLTDVVYSPDAQVEALADNGGTAIGRTGATQVIRTMALKAGALAIDGGSASVGAQPSFDQRGTGFPRVLDGVPDLGAVEGVPTPPPPPPPPPVFPASAPRDVTGVAGDGSVAVSWLPPADAGSFPVTDYRVTAGPGGRSCLAKAPALTCTVTGLTNGTAYTFVVTALNGAGWGASSVASAPVTPSADRARSLTLFQGKRTANGVHDRIRTGGTSVGVPEGARLTPWIRYGDTGAFKEGVASIVVDARGRFTWTREIRKDKKFTAYVAYEDLDSNRVVWARVR